MSPLLALRAAILARLAADPALAALMGGTVRLYDEPPRGTPPVYAFFGPAEIQDDSVDGATRHGHRHALIVVAQAGSARTAIEAAARIADLMTDWAPALSGHVLVAARIRTLSAARDERSGEARATLTLDAVTEAA